MQLSFSYLPVLLLALLLAACGQPAAYTLQSPNGAYQFELRTENGRPVYQLHFQDTEIIRPSALGFRLGDSLLLPAATEIELIGKADLDNNWRPVYGEKAEYRDHYQELLFRFGPENPGALQLRVRAYNEGLAFRYESGQGTTAPIQAELTEFALPAQSKLWVSTRAQSPISAIDISELKDTVERPLLAQLSDSLFVALGEAALVDFARMKLAPQPGKPATLVANLASEVSYPAAFTSPWRTIMAGRSAGELLENNYLLLNLNEPNQIDTTAWIKPGKVIREVTLTTQGGIACVDFAVKHHLQYIEFDAGWYGSEYDDASDATTVTVDPNRSKGPLDLPAVIQYAESKGIGVLLYVNRRALEKQLDEILPLFRSWGVKGVKYGFVNVGSQYWTTWLHEAVRKAAEHDLMVDIHDEYRPTGYSRTYPNLMTQEGIRGDEESPENSMVLHTLFTRMLAGAGDHTNCYFADRVDAKMGSHASQLAKAVCIYSPWQFLYWYDRPEGSPVKAGGAGNNDLYIQEVPELSFYDQLPTVWDDTRVLEGYPGSHAVIARRSGPVWYIGALNGAEAREFAIPLNFLDAGTTYQATIFTDDPTEESPTKVHMETMAVSSGDVISRQLGGQRGLAMRIEAVSQ